MGKKKLWGEAHSYKRLISIFEVVASELLFGLAVKCLEIQLFGVRKFWIEWFSHKTFDKEKSFCDIVRHTTDNP